MKVGGGCHCGEVRFEVDIPAQVRLLECNCSICTLTGYLHCIVPHQDFELITGRAALQSYRFGTGQAVHLFCKNCGIKSFYQPRSHPDCWSVHFACLDVGHGVIGDVVTFDGRDWDKVAGELS